MSEPLLPRQPATCNSNSNSNRQQATGNRQQATGNSNTRTPLRFQQEVRFQPRRRCHHIRRPPPPSPPDRLTIASPPPSPPGRLPSHTPWCDPHHPRAPLAHLSPQRTDCLHTLTNHTWGLSTSCLKLRGLSATTFEENGLEAMVVGTKAEASASREKSALDIDSAPFSRDQIYRVL